MILQFTVWESQMSHKMIQSWIGPKTMRACNNTFFTIRYCKEFYSDFIYKDFEFLRPPPLLTTQRVVPYNLGMFIVAVDVFNNSSNTGILL